MWTVDMDVYKKTKRSSKTMKRDIQSNLLKKKGNIFLSAQIIEIFEHKAISLPCPNFFNKAKYEEKRF